MDSDISVHEHIVCARFSETTHNFSSMDAQRIQYRVKRVIELSMEEPHLKDELIRGVEILERDVLSGEPKKRRMVKLKQRQLGILKKIVVTLGKKPEVVDKYITQKINENRETWKGDGKCIQSNEHGEITVLDLSMGQFSGYIPPEIGELTALTVLNLNSNQLTGFIPPEIGRLKALTRLILSGNELSGSIPSEIGQLINLSELWLYTNNLSGSIPPEIGELTNLRELVLGNNQLSGSIPPEIGKLTNLTGLSLSVNQLFFCQVRDRGTCPRDSGRMRLKHIIYDDVITIYSMSYHTAPPYLQIFVNLRFGIFEEIKKNPSEFCQFYGQQCPGCSILNNWHSF